MHLLSSANLHFVMVSVIHEVAAGIAVEYFNESNTAAKAFALVTAGPGMTNVVTALAGAYLESRELLIIGGQVKTADLSNGKLRQRGIQEIDGVAIAKPVSCASELIKEPIDRNRFCQLLASTSDGGRKGPVFLELPLDIQGRNVDRVCLERPTIGESTIMPVASAQVIAELAARIWVARRPMLLIGGGVSRATAAHVHGNLATMGLPVTTTWNAADRMDAAHPNYFGRPNTWGQRYANTLLQQCDLLVALGTRLGMQQTGFNWQKFVPLGDVVQVDCDKSELSKGHPELALAIHSDANAVLRGLAEMPLGNHSGWLGYCRQVKAALPLIEPNITGDTYISPYDFVARLSARCGSGDVVIPCSSGGAFTVMMQIFQQKKGQTVITNKGLASMGYGLAGAIGAAFANPLSRTVLVEGDGGFAQNLQEIGTVAVNQLNLKIFIFDDNGYASIRMTQKSYFSNQYIGCDINSGLGLPDWEQLFKAWRMPVMRINRGFDTSVEFAKLFENKGPAAFIVSVDPDQTYFPKITSRITENGSMESNPLHIMSPELDTVLPDLDSLAK